MIKFLRYLYQYFLVINIYEYKLKHKKIFEKKNQMFFINSANKDKNNKTSIEYYKKYKFK